MAQPEILGLGASNAVEQNEIQNAINVYFDARYRSMSSLQLEDLSKMIDTSTQGVSFLRAEKGKLEIEIKYAKLKKLGYTQFKKYLDFKNFVFSSSQSAVVTVVEGHDVVFEISNEISKINPIVSKMRNLQHTIAVSKVEGTWKIVSDNYEDDLWRLLKIPGNSQEELLLSINYEEENISQPVTSLDNLTTQCSLPADTSSYAYNRLGAVTYAHQWATAARPYNPVYVDYTDAGGDCTNFVNQAIHDGGNAQMVFGGTHGTNGNGQLGWYFYSSLDHATAWNYVTPLMEFITQYWVWPAGPEGCEVAVTGLQVGDLIQYDWEGTGVLWDHSAIVVNLVDQGSGVMMPYIASHTPDLDNYYTLA